MRKILFFLSSGLLAFGLASPVAAVSPWGNLRKTPPEVRQEIKAEVAQNISTRPGLLKFFLGKRIVLGSGKLTAVNGTTLTVEKDSKSYAVLTGTFESCLPAFRPTQLRRRFWGKSEISEMSIGDTLNVFGHWQDEAKTTIEACLIRDKSIQKRFGVFVGKVLSLTSNGWVMSTVSARRPDQTVVVSDSTKFINRRNEAIGKSDVAVGHRVRVKGLWNNQTNTITEVVQVKDYSLPPIPTPSSASSPTPTPTPTGT